MMKWKIYPAGSFNDDWRTDLKEHAGNHIEWLEPIVLPGQMKKADRDPNLVVPRDLALIKRADILAGYWLPESRNIGLSAEIGLAYAWGIPCVVAIPPECKVAARFVRGLVFELDSFSNLLNFLYDLEPH